MIKNKVTALLHSDIKYNKAAEGFVVAVYLTIVFLAAFCPSFFRAEAIGDLRFKSNYFIYADFILPLIFSMFVMIVLNRDLNRKTYEYVITLSISPFQIFIVRFLVYLLFFSGLLFLFMIVSKHSVSHWLPSDFTPLRFMLNSFVNLWFFLCFSFFVAVALKNDFASYLIFLGPVLIDFFTQSEVFEQYSLFIHTYRSYLGDNIYRQNRVVLCVFALLFLFLSSLILCKQKLLFVKHISL